MRDSVSSYRSAETLDHLRGLHRDYLEQPFEVSLETLALCNAACTFCPYPTLERKGQKMPTGLIYRLIDEMAAFPKPFFFSPFKVNEPLLDKRLFDICRTATERTKAMIRLFTNGSPLTDRNVDKIAELDGVAHLWVSLNSVDDDEHMALMGLPFEKIAQNLDRLHKREFPHQVVVSTVGIPNQPFLDYCHSRWPNFSVCLIPNTGWLGYVDSDFESIPDEPCSRWWELSIMADGRVALCCMDGTGQYAIGDVTKQTLLEVYNSPQWRERREELQSRRGIDPCHRCSY